MFVFPFSTSCQKPLTLHCSPNLFFQRYGRRLPIVSTASAQFLHPQPSSVCHVKRPSQRTCQYPPEEIEGLAEQLAILCNEFIAYCDARGIATSQLQLVPHGQFGAGQDFGHIVQNETNAVQTTLVLRLKIDAARWAFTRANNPAGAGSQEERRQQAVEAYIADLQRYLQEENNLIESDSTYTAPANIPLASYNVRACKNASCRERKWLTFSIPRLPHIDLRGFFKIPTMRFGQRTHIMNTKTGASKCAMMAAENLVISAFNPTMGERNLWAVAEAECSAQVILIPGRKEGRTAKKGVTYRASGGHLGGSRTKTIDTVHIHVTNRDIVSSPVYWSQFLQFYRFLESELAKKPEQLVIAGEFRGIAVNFGGWETMNVRKGVIGGACHAHLHVYLSPCCINSLAMTTGCVPDENWGALFGRTRPVKRYFAEDLKDLNALRSEHRLTRLEGKVDSMDKKMDRVESKLGRLEAAVDRLVTVMENASFRSTYYGPITYW